MISTAHLIKTNYIQWLVFANAAIIPLNGVIALSRLLMALFLVSGIFRLVRNNTLNAQAWPIWLWFSIPFCSLFWSQDLDVSIGNLSHDVIYPCVFFTLGAYALRESERVKVIEGFLCGMFAVTLITLYRVFSHSIVDPVEMQPLNHGIGEYSTIIVLAISSLTFFYRKWNLALLLGFFVVFLLGLLVTQNRMGWLSLISVVIALGLICWIKAPTHEKIRVLIFTIFLSAILFAAYYFIASGKSISAFERDLQGNSAILTLFHNERFEMWKFWLGEGLKNPWLGFGFGYEMTQSLYAGIKNPILDLVNIHAHNVFVDYFLQLGLLGLSVFIFAMSWLIARAISLMKDQDNRIDGVALLLIVVAMLSKSLTDDFFTRTPLLAFWLMVGVLLGPSLRMR